MYSLDKSVLSFAVSNGFAQQMNKVCHKLGENYRPFCFFANEEQVKAGVMDFTQFNGLVDRELTLLDEVAAIRRGVYAASGIRVGDDSQVKRTLFFDYLMSSSICYIEVPKYTTKDGLAQKTYDKFFVTRNPAVMAIWMGCTPAEMQAKYSARIQTSVAELSDGLVRAVKLMSSAKGNSVSVPRGAFSTKDMTCIPLFMMYAFQKGFEGALREKVLKFRYLKDNGTIRELYSTLSHDILMGYYSDTAFVGGMIAGSDVDSVQQGGMNMSSKMSRGYIRVPEIGSSIYDRSGVRALNLARLLSIEEVDPKSVDTSYIRVDLNSVEGNFCDCLDYAVKKFPDQMVPIYSAAIGKDPGTGQPAVVAEMLKDEVRKRCILMSTQFQRELHMFMARSPQWFPLYTGKPNAASISSKSFGVEEMDF